ncbi:MAG: 6-phosphofructokinase [Clostridiales bacterium]|mgnify:CR=1 FL=1|jgi:6-phosphofructokinase 1|nr:6-phosphofructokinase [Clostridiales bacterium]
MRIIGVLTSGGDAPGMNACIRAVVRTALYFGMKVYGISRGYYGLVNDDVIEMHLDSVSDIIQRGGTILYTARCDEFKTKEGMEKSLSTVKKYGIEGIIAIGGDGTFRGAIDLSTHGVPAVGIPGTIDNDLPYTDYTLGFDTAVNTCLNLINNLRDTMTSHERVSIVEVMGRNCGDIALYAGVGGGAEAIIIPEVPINLDDIIKRMQQSRDRGKRSNIILLAEGAGSAENLAKELREKTGYSIRSTIIGHVQRGGAPTMADRILASKFGYHAVELLKNDTGNRAVGIVNNKIVDIDLVEAMNMKRPVDMHMFKLAEILAL